MKNKISMFIGACLVGLLFAGCGAIEGWLKDTLTDDAKVANIAAVVQTGSEAITVNLLTKYPEAYPYAVAVNGGLAVAINSGVVQPAELTQSLRKFIVEDAGLEAVYYDAYIAGAFTLVFTVYQNFYNLNIAEHETETIAGAKKLLVAMQTGIAAGTRLTAPSEVVSSLGVTGTPTTVGQEVTNGNPLLGLTLEDLRLTD